MASLQKNYWLLKNSACGGYTKIIADLQEASQLFLPESNYTGDDIGRVNKHTQLWDLSKVYMTIAGDLTKYNTETHTDKDVQIRILPILPAVIRSPCPLRLDHYSGEFHYCPTSGPFYTRRR
jgi:hypothetical protein